MTITVLKDNLMHIQIFKILSGPTLVQIRQHQTKSGEEHSANRSYRKGFYREDVEAKRGNYLIGYSLSSCLFWESLIGCL